MQYGSAPGRTAGGQAQQNQAGPFRRNTRQRRQPLQTIQVTGPNTTLTPPAFYQVGFAQRVLLRCRLLAQVDGAGITAGGYAYKAPWNSLRRISLDFTLGATNIFNATGFGAHILQNSRHRAAFDTDSSLTNDPFYNLPSLAAVAANSVLPIEFTIEVPISANDGMNFGLGLLNLQSPEAQLALSITLGSITDIFNSTAAAHVTNVTGNIYVEYEYYEVPSANRRTKLPPLLVHRVWEDTQPILATGDTIYQIPRQGRLLRLAQYIDNVTSLIVSGDPQIGSGGYISPNTPGVLSWKVLANITDSVYLESYGFRRWLMEMEFGRGGNAAALATGGVAPLGGGNLWEFFGATGEPATGDFRDVFDTEAITTLQFVTTLDSAVALNAGAQLGMIREFWQPLSASAVQGGIGG